ncbi:MAG TPA: oligosaccharide flippase family protein, partial [bacterium]|nr:oligosaccharide flippase family protein [bacterium]
MKKLSRRFLDSLVSSYLVQGLNSGTNFLIKLGLAWLIAPADFGLFAVVLLVVSVLNMVRDGGIELQAVRDREPALGSVFWFHFAGGILLAAGLWLAAPLFTGFGDGLPAALRQFSPAVLFTALTSVPLLQLHRTLQLAKTVVPRLAQLATFAVLATWLAYAGQGVAALIIAKVASELVLAVTLWLRVRGLGLPAFAFSWQETRRLLRGGRMLYLLAISDVLIIDIDKGILSRYCAETVVGYYFFAWSVVFFVSKLVEPACSKVLFPAFSRLADDAVRTARLYTWMSLTVMLIEVPLYLALALHSSDLVTVLFPAVWSPMVGLISLLAFLPIIEPFSMFGLEVLRARGHDAPVVLTSLGGLFLMTVLGSILTVRYGAPGMILAN